MKTILALDIGTTHIKGMLFDDQGRTIKGRKKQTPLVKRSGSEVYDPEALWQMVLELITDLLNGQEKKPDGITVTGMAEAGLVMEQETGKALTEILPWYDKRTQAIAAETDAKETEERFYQTGLRNSYKYGIYKYLWLLKNRSLSGKGTIWLSVCDYIVFCLTGKMVTEPTMAARTYVYDIRKMSWDVEKLQSLGLTLANFPTVVSSGSCVGKYEQIPVSLAGHDHVCAAFGLLHGREKSICDSAGTSETYIGILDQSPDDLQMSLSSGMIYGPYVGSGYFYMMNIPSSGHSVEWFRKKLQLEELTYEIMNEKLKELEDGPTGILYFPWLTGMGSPWFRADMQAGILGLTEVHTGIHLLKGMIEGVQYQARWLMELLAEKHKVEADTLICAGGAVWNKVLMQIKADVLGKKLEVPGNAEATLSGAAALHLYKNEGEEAAAKFLETAAAVSIRYEADVKIQSNYEKIFRNGYLPFTRILGSL